MVEILVVVAMVALLAAILFPVIGSAKRQGKLTQCASNLKQLGNAFTLYISDWGGVYPSPGGLSGDNNYWAQTGNGGLVGYIKKNGGIGTIWCCPELTSWHGQYPARTYSMNSFLRNPPDIAYPGSIRFLEGITEDQIEQKSNTILLFEGMPLVANRPNTPEYDYIYRCGDWDCVAGRYPVERPKSWTINSTVAWHKNRNNFLYCDGHIKSAAPIKYPASPPLDITNEWWVKKAEMAARYKR